MIEERLGRLAIPVATGGPIGHGSRNVAVPYGALVELDTRFGTLTALEGVVGLNRACSAYIARGRGRISDSSITPKRSS